MSDPISESLEKLVKFFERQNIPYVFVGGVSVLVFGRIRMTTDVDVIIDHRELNRGKFVEYLQNVGFDATLEDFKAFDERMHCSFFLKEGMFRIDMKGVYSTNEETSINMALSEKFNDIEIRVDHPVNIIPHKLLFGSEQDYEDALAVYIRNKEIIDHNILKKIAVDLDITEKLTQFLTEVNEFLEKQ